MPTAPAPPQLGRPRGDRDPAAACRGGRRPLQRPGYGRRKSDFADSDEPPPGPPIADGVPPSGRRAGRRRPVPSRRPPPSPACVPTGSPAFRTPPGPSRHPDAAASPSSGDVPARRIRRRASARGTAAERRPRAARPPSARPAPAPDGRTAEATRRPARSPSSAPSDLEDTDDLDATPRESALAWLRFAGELDHRAGRGRRRLLRRHAAVGAAAPRRRGARAARGPGLVAGVSVWRQRQGREPRRGHGCSPSSSSPARC